MNVAQLPVVGVGRAFAGESPDGMSAAARLDDQLAGGTVPDEFIRHYDERRWQPVRTDTFQLSMALTLLDRSTQAAGNKKRYFQRMMADCLTRGIIGGVVGGVLLSGAAASMALPAVAMAAIAAGMGAFSAWYKLHQHDQGKVVITNDGVERTGQFHLDPKNFDQTSQELRAMLLSKGYLGDRIQASQRPDLQNLAVDEARLKALTPELPTLQELDGDRRLVAHLGNKSAYGHDVLDLVDADAARKLMAAGTPVYVVNGEGTQDVAHRLQVTAKSPDSKRLHLDAFDHTERQFKYHLSPIRSAEDLASVEPADGIPQGMVGVYEHAGQVSIPVYRQAQSDTTSHSKEANSHVRSEFEQAEASDVARGEKIGSYTTYHMNFRDIGMLLFAAVGIATAVAITGPGVPGPALLGLLGSGFVGRVLGQKLSDSKFGTIGRREN